MCIRDSHQRAKTDKTNTPKSRRYMLSTVGLCHHCRAPMAIIKTCILNLIQRRLYINFYIVARWAQNLDRAFHGAWLRDQNIPGCHNSTRQAKLLRTTDFQQPLGTLSSGLFRTSVLSSYLGFSHFVRKVVHLLFHFRIFLLPDFW